jgi:RNA polymerase sigma-70 factor (ECF subfamily)
MSSRSDITDLIDAVREREAVFDFEAVFRAQYSRIARVIARVVRDPARSEEIAVEVFLKLWRSPSAQGERAEGWLYRVAVRKALDELRRQARRARYERLFGFGQPTANPEQSHAANEEQQRVRTILALMEQRQAELLLLRANELSYGELAAALRLNPASVGTLLCRAQQAFRKEYVRRYGQE